MWPHFFAGKWCWLSDISGLEVKTDDEGVWNNKRKWKSFHLRWHHIVEQVEQEWDSCPNVTDQSELS